MRYENNRQQERPAEKMYSLMRAFYEEKDTEKILAFYDPKAICWFGMTDREEAYPIRGLREKLQAVFDSMQEICMEKENYEVVSENHNSCMISGSLDLTENGEQKEFEISAFWTFFEESWCLSRFCIQLAGREKQLPEPENDTFFLEKARSQALINLTQGTVLEYDVSSDCLDLYIQRAQREPKKHMVYPDFLKERKALFFSAVCSEDREKLEKALFGPQDYRVVEFRFQEKEGLYAWKRLTFQRLRDPEGKVLRLLGNVIDISQEMELREEARKDSLTGAYNRHGLNTLVEDYCAELRRRKNSSRGAVFLLDLDNFKNLNDACGHLAGDQVLKDLVKIVKSHFRSDDRVFRMGGDEFLVLMKDVPGSDIVRRKGQEIIDDFCGYAKQYDTGGVPLGVSIGAVLFDRNVSGDTEIYQRADQALYEAKHAGKKGIRIDE